jgi:DNA repair protein RadA/Sms
MAKSLGVKYVCSNCGAAASSWTGRCQNCGEWNTLQEQVEANSSSAKSSGVVLKAESISKAAASKLNRISSGIGDVDIVLGGGIVAGSVNLLAGQPGIGKSTLLLQLAYNISKNHNALYVSGEESARQVALRAERLGTESKSLQLAVSNVTNDIALQPHFLPSAK